MAVFVVDKNHIPLMPCSEKRAKFLLTKKRARIHHMYPFTIRMIDRIVEESSLQPLRCKIDPGSVTTGIALVLEKDFVQRVIALMELQHRGLLIKQRLQSRSAYRKRRRSNLRYRAPRFDNRTRKSGWLAPSLQHRVDSILHTVQSLQKIAPLTAATCEVVRFDTQRLKNPEIQAIEYQRGTLFGYEIREYLLEKWGRKCVYCDAKDIPLEIDHMTPKSLGGSDRVDNLTICCRMCNLKKGNTPLEVFAPKKAESIRQAPSFRDSAAVNSTRHKTFDSISLHLPCEAGTGGQTKYNRALLCVPKTHALDAACAGKISFLENWQIPTHKIVCMGRGSYQRTRNDCYGFPRGYLTRQKQIRGFQTGDRVRANIPRGKKKGNYSGRIAVRASGNFNLKTESKLVEGVSWKYCHLIERGNGYHYENINHIKQKEHVSSPP